MAWWLSSDRYMAKACKLKSKSPKHQADAQDWPFYLCHLWHFRNVFDSRYRGRSLFSRRYTDVDKSLTGFDPTILNPGFKAVKSPDIRLRVSNMDSFHGLLFTQRHFNLVFHSKLANNSLVYTAGNDNEHNKGY